MKHIKSYIKVFPQYLIPKHLLSQVAGCLANVKNPQVKNFLIKSFIKKYKVNMSEALQEEIDSYNCFNDFFIRHLKPDCRPLAKADLVSPVDGFLNTFGEIKKGQIFQAKRRFYTVEQLLKCDQELSKHFLHGSFATFYLSPKDYHRIHMPIDGLLNEMIYIPGKLFSVQPVVTKVIPQLFARNERLVIFFKIPQGFIAMVLVGAVIVGAIGTRWTGDLPRLPREQYFSYQDADMTTKTIKQGDEIAYFKLGSSVVMLFSEGCQVQWLNNLVPGQSILCGQALGATRLPSS